jgi:hypothetical protein
MVDRQLLGDDDLHASAGQPASRRLSRALRDTGFSYDFRRHRISRTGKLEAAWPYLYLGADDRTGPNHTGQPAVTSSSSRWRTTCVSPTWWRSTVT